MAHGYWSIGHFAILGPPRHTDVAYLSAFLSTIGPIVIYKTQEGWNEYTSGFLIGIGGIGGAIFAYALLDFVVGRDFFGHFS